MLSKVRKMTLEQNENFNKDIDSKKKNQIEMLELKNTITQLKIHYRGSRTDSMKQKKESVNSKTCHWKLSSQRNTKKKG